MTAAEIAVLDTLTTGDAYSFGLPATQFPVHVIEGLIDQDLVMTFGAGTHVFATREGRCIVAEYLHGRHTAPVT